MKPYKRQAAGLALTAVVTTVMNLAPGLIQRNLINTVLTGHHALHHLYLMMALWLGVVVVSVGAQIFTGRLTAFLAGHIAADLRAGLYRAIEFLQLGYFDKKQVGAITSRVTQDTDRVWGFLVDGAPFIITNGLLIVGVAVFLLRANVYLTLCILAPVPVVLLIAAAFWKPMSTLFHRVGQKWAQVPHAPERIADGHSGGQSVRAGGL